MPRYILFMSCRPLVVVPNHCLQHISNVWCIDYIYVLSVSLELVSQVTVSDYPFAAMQLKKYIGSDAGVPARKIKVARMAFTRSISEE